MNITVVLPVHAMIAAPGQVIILVLAGYQYQTDLTPTCLCVHLLTHLSKSLSTPTWLRIVLSSSGGLFRQLWERSK